MKDRILVVDDDQDQCDLLELSLGRLGFEITTRTSGKAALELVTSEDFDVLVTDVGLGEMSGLDLTERVLGARPDLPVIVITGQGTMEVAIQAMRAGAYDFLSKPLDAKLLGLAVSRAAQHRHLTRELQRLRGESKSLAFDSLVGKGEAMRRVIDLVRRVSSSDASVLIHGETGTGKELIARAVHASSARANQPFVAINCAAVPASLLESELFGHTKGSFTDARADRKGLFVQADGGTLFLDEIGEMPLDMQAKLLRALQERTVRPVGGNTEIAFDARIVAATNKDLEGEVFAKRFREDFYYRINVVTIELPSLRQRGTDVLDLAVHFLAKQKTRATPLTLSPAVAEKLIAYDWPGNVRELENCIERAVALARFDELTVEDLPQRIRAYRADGFVVGAENADEILTLDELERRSIVRVLKLLDGNKSRVAQVLGLDRRTLYRKLDRYALAAAATE